MALPFYHFGLFPLLCVWRTMSKNKQKNQKHILPKKNQNTYPPFIPYNFLKLSHKITN